mmetsp:Transcript_19595/g.50618  ORF Transcript_19595/g.50618 Transcript_19595/m.50618 type:complete len:237 (+) Transcript_19595:343-1053(+)
MPTLSLHGCPAAPMPGRHCMCPGNPRLGASRAPCASSPWKSSMAPPKRAFHFSRFALLCALASSMIWAISFGSLRACFMRAAANSCIVFGALLLAPPPPAICVSSSSLRMANRISRSCRAAMSASDSSRCRLIFLPEMTLRTTSALFDLCLSLSFFFLRFSFRSFSLCLCLCSLSRPRELLSRLLLRLSLSRSLSFSFSCERFLSLRRSSEEDEDDESLSDDEEPISTTCECDRLT